MYLLKDIDVVIFDIDGTLMVDGNLLPLAKETVLLLRIYGKKVYFLTNNSSHDHLEYMHLLRDLNATEKEIIISSDGTLAWLKEQQLKAYVLGTKQLIDQFKVKHLFKIDNPDIVVVGYDKDLTYDKLQYVCEMVNSGTPYVLTHTDNTCPTKLGPVPDCGLIGKMIQQCTGKAPIKVFGKPNPECISHINYFAPATAMVGDRTNTDMELAIRTGINGFLISETALPSKQYTVIKSLEELL